MTGKLNFIKILKSILFKSSSFLLHQHQTVVEDYIQKQGNKQVKINKGSNNPNPYNKQQHISYRNNINFGEFSLFYEIVAIEEKLSFIHKKKRCKNTICCIR